MIYLDINGIILYHQELKIFCPAQMYFGKMICGIHEFANSMNMLAFAALSSAKNVETIASVSTTHAIQIIKNSQELEKKFWKLSRVCLC